MPSCACSQPIARRVVGVSCVSSAIASQPRPISARAAGCFFKAIASATPISQHSRLVSSIDHLCQINCVTRGGYRRLSDGCVHCLASCRVAEHICARVLIHPLRTDDISVSLSHSAHRWAPLRGHRVCAAISSLVPTRSTAALPCGALAIARVPARTGALFTEAVSLYHVASLNAHICSALIYVSECTANCSFSSDIACLAHASDTVSSVSRSLAMTLPLLIECVCCSREQLCVLYHVFTVLMHAIRLFADATGWTRLVGRYWYRWH